MDANVIEINNLTKYYGRKKRHRGIVDVSFNVAQGEIFGFIGPNGAGKSTTMRVLLALIFPTRGEARIFGKDCIKEASEIAKDVGYLPSEVFYYDGMKVIDLLRYSASFFKKDCSARIKELSERLELDLNRKIEDLSYGNKKKVGIVQGLLHSPKLIMLDEPTGGLDPLIQQTFFDILREENKKGATILFSSHILSEVQKMCDRVAIIKDGKIVGVRKISELRNDNYKKYGVTAANPIDADYFKGEGVMNYVTDKNSASFMFKGDINGVIAKLSGLELTDVSIEEPSLEEIFLHYYE
ncbi:MAG: ABC transporter ATP-binding protein [Oscillospiraceae bacterium]|jgi:ABC-2 type transport system ATP-binding protein|nr:ABC transporter ATP-binding protein [Oscillospiraceae bacterium]